MAIKSCNDIKQPTRRGRDKRVVHEEVKKGRFTEKGFFFPPTLSPFRCAERVEAHFIRAAAEGKEEEEGKEAGSRKVGREERKVGRECTYVRGEDHMKGGRV